MHYFDSFNFKALYKSINYIESASLYDFWLVSHGQTVYFSFDMGAEKNKGLAYYRYMFCAENRQILAIVDWPLIGVNSLQRCSPRMTYKVVYKSSYASFELWWKNPHSTSTNTSIMCSLRIAGDFRGMYIWRSSHKSGFSWVKFHRLPRMKPVFNWKWHVLNFRWWSIIREKRENYILRKFPAIRYITDQLLEPCRTLPVVFLVAAR